MDPFGNCNESDYRAKITVGDEMLSAEFITKRKRPTAPQIIRD